MGRFFSKGTDLVPTGVILKFLGTTAPTGYLICSGQSLSTTTYADLFSVIGYTFGGSGATFKLPSQQGRSFVAPGITKNVNPDIDSDTHVAETYEIGKTYNDTLQTHTHTVTRRPGSGSVFANLLDNNTGIRDETNTNTDTGNNSGNRDTSTRCKGVAINYIIKT
jgi:microcystin-dependent protein